MPKAEAASKEAIMLINDNPGQETRIAIMRNGRLDDLLSERPSTATSVGNIYRGRVTNVEAAIQAAFVDFGHGKVGFLHVTDLHKKYFPGENKKEKIGKKTPRSERPPIQDCLKKGDIIDVQVIKEGIGTKGPTLSSNLAIPGRYLVMFPWQDGAGVSRNDVDEEIRRKTREIVKALEKPDESAGLVARTAAFGKTATDLKRDVAYLKRLWKTIETRIDKAGVPCELYTESDLVLRTIRDQLGPEITKIVVDSESAYERVTAFLSVVAPRSAPPVVLYDRPTPLFHAYRVEPQITELLQREVPLKSGGALVLDQTEALVAIDVNSGRSRSAKDAETNAYSTNCEAVDEIARQLRLRDLGGVVVLDLIDMRLQKQRREIRDRLDKAMEHDRAKKTIGEIDRFGLLSLTRQRMRPGVDKEHFRECDACHGRGRIRNGDSLGSENLRQAAFLLSREEVGSVELVCHPEVAAALFASRRQEFVALEEETGKSLHVRVNDRMIRDQVDLYAYDERGADLPVEKFKDEPVPKFEHLQKEAELRAEATEHDEDDDNPSGSARRRRRRRRKSGPADAAAVALSEDLQRELEEIEQEELRTEAEAAARAAWIAVLEGKGEDLPKVSSLADRQSTPSKDASVSDDSGSGGKRRRRRRRRGGSDENSADLAAQAIQPPEAPVAVHVLAKEAGLKSTLLLDRIREELGFDVKSYMTRLAPDQVVKVKEMLLPEPASSGDGEPSDGPSEVNPENGTRSSESDASDSDSGTRKKRRRRRRRGRGRSDSDQDTTNDAADGPSSNGKNAETKSPEEPQSSADDVKPRRPRRSAKKTQKKKETSDGSGPSASQSSTPSSTAEDKPKPKLSRLRRSVRRTSGTRTADRE
ncbi:MAG: Rne/Rng family ribonuclease [Phycisphaeraceae bacterium]|nr:MAG: Rne/Rng family ribonuclease [Phycisphaeraceae bacterium]